VKNKKRLIIIEIVLGIAIIAVIIFIVKNVKGQEHEEKQLSTSNQYVVETTIEQSLSQPTTQKETTKQTATKPITTSGQSFVEAATIKIDENKWNLTLLNREYKLPDGYVPKTATITLSDNDPRRTEKALSQVLDYRVAPEYQKMYDAAVQDGIYLTPYSGYRSISFQKQIFNNYVDMYKKQGYATDAAKYKASMTSLPPGTSEHNMGMAMDIVNTKNDFENSKEYAWLETNAQDYGFILRYPKNKTEKTQIMHEPWHWRYVGVEAAKALKASGQCLEEYLGVK